MDINWGLIAPIIALQFMLMVAALISLIRADSVRGAKWIWAMVIIFASLVGSIVYFLIGRKEA
ncbi:Negative regulatory protein YxlE [compost metagenome]